MKDYHHGHLKQLLLDEGLKLLSEEGYDRFSLRKLARRCNVSHTSPYRHFSDKNELIRAIAREVQEKFNEALKEAMENVNGSQMNKVKAMGRGYVHFFLDHPDYLELLFLTPELQDLSCEKHNHPEGSSFATYLSAVAPLFSESLPEGMELPDEPSSPDSGIPGALLQPWCLIHGLTVLLVKKAIPVSDPGEIDRLIDQVLPTGEGL